MSRLRQQSDDFFSCVENKKLTKSLLFTFALSKFKCSSNRYFQNAQKFHRETFFRGTQQQQMKSNPLWLNTINQTTTRVIIMSTLYMLFLIIIKQKNINIPVSALELWPVSLFVCRFYRYHLSLNCQHLNLEYSLFLKKAKKCLLKILLHCLLIFYSFSILKRRWEHSISPNKQLIRFVWFFSCLFHLFLAISSTNCNWYYYIASPS